MSQVAEMRNFFIMGDKAATVARELGVLPRAMVTSQIPLIEEMFPGIDNLECTRCIMTDKRQILYSAAKTNNINHVILEKDSPESDYWSGFNPSEIKEELEAEGIMVDIIDFSKGLEAGVLNAGQLFERERLASRIMRKYHTELDEVVSTLPDFTGTKVAAVVGFIHPVDGTNFMVVDNSGSYFDRNVISKFGCENVSPLLLPPENGSSDMNVITNFERLKEAAPDLIAISGDTQAGLAEIRRIIKDNPDLSEITALKNHAVYGLPYASGGEPLNYPGVLKKWTRALCL